MRVIAYRPDYIGPTKEEAQLGQKLIYGFFAPVGAAVRATQIGQAMIEVTARGDEFSNGRKLGTRTIIRPTWTGIIDQASSRSKRASNRLHARSAWTSL